MIWQMMVTMLHSNGQQTAETDGHIQKGCQKPAVQQNTTDDSPCSGTRLLTNLKALRPTASLNQRIPNNKLHMSSYIRPRPLTIAPLVFFNGRQ